MCLFGSLLQMEYWHSGLGVRNLLIIISRQSSVSLFLKIYHFICDTHLLNS